MSAIGGFAMPEEMTCRELVEVITDYLEGTMPASDRGRFEAHLRECPYCATYLEQMRETIATVGELREEALDRRVRERMLDAFRGWRSSSTQ
jgi:anti-sigma factor RsiW